MSTSRESWFECRFVSEEGEWVSFVRGWDAAMAEAAFRDELGESLAAAKRGCIRVAGPVTSRTRHLSSPESSRTGTGAPVAGRAAGAE